MVEDNYFVHFTKIAINDLDEIYRYISEALFADNAATDLLGRIESSIMRLRVFPNSGSRLTDEYLRLKGYRRIIVDEKRRQVIIMRVLYGKQNYKNLL